MRMIILIADLIGHPSSLTQGRVPESLLRLIVRDHISWLVSESWREPNAADGIGHTAADPLRGRQLTAETQVIIGDASAQNSHFAGNSDLLEYSFSSSTLPFGHHIRTASELTCNLWLVPDLRATFLHCCL
jgi:hypothetical protein